MEFHLEDMFWTYKPSSFDIGPEYVEILTMPHTDLWQRTYYHFRNDSAPMLQMMTEEPFFTFVVKTEFDPRSRFDQCGVVVYLDSENWIKASVEYEDKNVQKLGSVVTNHGYSDWATSDIGGDVRTMWYRLSRREDDFRIESSFDGADFTQMRICHLFEAAGPVPFGIYACSPEDGSFRARFTNMQLTDCVWEAHDGQPPDA